MRSIILVLCCTLLSHCIISQETTESVIDKSKYFEFHNNYWINLHHFLYQKAKGSQLERLKRNDLTLLDINEEDVFKNLSDDQATKLENVIIYYKDSIVQRSLRTELADIRVWLQDQSTNEEIVDTTFSKKYTDLLNQASSVYKTTFWPIHKSHNQKILSDHIQNIKALESKVIPRLEELSQHEWPSKLEVRVDLTAYANWAGAYTPTRPRMNLFISTLDPRSPTSDFIEIVFHEGSHLLFNFDGPFRSTIFDMSKEMGIDHPRHLWHACLFYLCGRICQDELKTIGIDHLLYMNERNVFGEYNNQAFRTSLEKYMDDKINLNETLEELLNHLE